MYKVSKQTINYIGNVQTTQFINYVDVQTTAEFDAIIRSFHGRAKAENQAFIVRGKRDRVRYVFTLINAVGVDKAIKKNKSYINDAVKAVNNYIDNANTAAKRSAKINSRKNVDLLQHVNVDDYWVDNKHNYIEEFGDIETYVY